MSTSRNTDARIEADYPPPIAVLWSRRDRADGVAARTQRLHALVECVVGYANALLLSDYAPEEVDEDLDAVLNHARPSLGTRVTLLRRLAAWQQEQGEDGFFPEAGRWVFAAGGKESASFQLLKRLVEARNRDAHPDRLSAPDAEDEQRYLRLVEDARVLLDGMSWLGETRLFRVVQSDQASADAMRGQVEHLVGIKRPFPREPFSWPSVVPLRTDRLWAWKADRRRVLDVGTFILLQGSSSEPTLAYFSQADGALARFVDPFASAAGPGKRKLKTHHGECDLEQWRAQRREHQRVWALDGAVAPPRLHAGRRVGGRYRLERELGRGQNAEVWEASDVETGGRVAVKVLSVTASDDRALRERFGRETDALRTVRHEHLVVLREALLVDHRPAMVLELYPSGTLRDRVRKDSDHDQVKIWTAQILRALVALHERGIVHRDIKPDNIFLTALDDVVVGDLGIAVSAEDPKLTQRGEVLGTFEYIAAEYRHEGEATPAVDIYALAVTAHELWFGRLPNQERPGTSIPGEFGELVRAMGSPSAKDRPTAEQALAQLRPVEVERSTRGEPPEMSETSPSAGVLWGLGSAISLFGLSGAGLAALVGAAWLLRPAWNPVSPPAPANTEAEATAPPEGPPPVPVSAPESETPSVPAPTAPSVPAPSVHRGAFGIELVRIPEGSYASGGRTIALSRALWVGATEVTQRQWRDVMKSAPWEGRLEWVQKRTQLVPGGACREAGTGASLPAVCVSWLEAVEFCNRLSEAEGLQPAYEIVGERVSWRRHANGYRLLTEAEWEYAARAGGAGPWGAESADPTTCKTANLLDRRGLRLARVSPDLALKCDDGHGGVAPVRSYAPNAWGLHETVGNAWEWTWDVKAALAPGPVVDPAGPADGETRVRRGGGWSSTADQVKVTNRVGLQPNKFNRATGLRVARWAP